MASDTRLHTLDLADHGSVEVAIYNPQFTDERTEILNNREAADVMETIRRTLPEMAAHLDANYSNDRERVKAIRVGIEASGRT